MTNQFKNKYLVRYIAEKGNEKLEIFGLEVIEIPNPISHSNQKEVIYTYNDYEMAKEKAKIVDGDILYDGFCYWMMANCAGMEYASKIFWDKFKEFRK